MNGAYNVAVRYLQSKYGRELGYTCTFENKLRKARNVWERNELEQNATNRDKNIIIKSDLIEKGSPDDVLNLTLKQYNSLSIAPKRELEQLLIRMKIDFEPKYIL